MNKPLDIIEIDSEEFFKFMDVCNPFFTSNNGEIPLLIGQHQSGHPLSSHLF